MTDGGQFQTVVLTWIHALAAVLWIGGMFFLFLVLAPVLKRGTFGADRRFLFQALARRFRVAAWVSIALLVVTGPLLIISKGGSFVEPEGLRSVQNVKLLLVTILIALTAMHDFWLGPLVGRLRKESPQAQSSADQLLVQTTTAIARLAVLLAIAILFLAVSLRRMPII
jgi:uncharacterized membrane protein